MQRIVSFLALSAAFILFSVPASPAADADEFFNGKNLEGWEGLVKEFWSVKDGAIVGNTFPKGLKFNTFLCSKKKYGDFELSFQVLMKGGKGNSGVQIRSEIFDMKKFAVKGPQCDMGAQYWGSLYGEHFGGMMKAAPKDAQKAVKPADWNDYSIKAVGKHITIKINGTTMVDQDFPKAPDTGIIAWQLHTGGPMEITFKNIKFKELKK